MNSVIKERIDKINQEIVPEGYKKTEIGAIPKDWDIKLLEELCKITTGNKDTQDKQEEGLYPFFVRSNTIERINSYSYDGESILTAGDGVGTGKVFHYINEKFEYHQRVYCLNQFNNINGKFLFYYFSENFIRQVFKYSAKTSVDSVRKEMLTKMNVPMPPLQEQEKIADILSTWDKSIEKIEKLIKEKDIQKKGLMQQLLTGETRLPGFNEEWKEVKLGELSKIITGTTPSTKKVEYFGEKYPWVTPTDISHRKYIKETERNLSEKGIKVGRFVPKDSLLITCIASIGKNAILEVDGSCNQQINAIYPSDNHSNEFLYYLLSYKENYLLSYASKTATMMINKNTFENIAFIIPLLEEQEAISEILSTADKEIELLKQLLENKKEEKKGLMQLLLTGIVRV